MGIVVATFVSVMVMTLGLYWAVVERPEAHEGSALRRRLRGGGTVRKISAALLKDPVRLSEVDVIQRLLARHGALFGPLQATIAQSGKNVTVGTVLLCGACLGVLVFALVLRWFHAPLLAMGCAAAGAWAPIAYVRMARNARMMKIEEQFPEAIDLLGRALARRPRLHDRPLDGGRGGAGSDRRRIQAALRPAELRHAAAAGAEGVRRTGAASLTPGSSSPPC